MGNNSIRPNRIIASLRDILNDISFRAIFLLGLPLSPAALRVSVED